MGDLKFVGVQHDSLCGFTNIDNNGLLSSEASFGEFWTKLDSLKWRSKREENIKDNNKNSFSAIIRCPYPSVLCCCPRINTYFYKKKETKKKTTERRREKQKEKQKERETERERNRKREK